jgi:hypothetical protein
VRYIERRLFRINDELARLSAERALIEAELAAHRSIDDDAQRDAVLGIESLEAKLTRDDVRRFQSALASLGNRITRLLSKREVLLQRISPIE